MLYIYYQLACTSDRTHGEQDLYITVVPKCYILIVESTLQAFLSCVEVMKLNRLTLTEL